jgi:hypothetical protein
MVVGLQILPGRIAVSVEEIRHDLAQIGLSFRKIHKQQAFYSATIANKHAEIARKLGVLFTITREEIEDIEKVWRLSLTKKRLRSVSLLSVALMLLNKFIYSIHHAIGLEIEVSSRLRKLENPLQLSLVFLKTQVQPNAPNLTA